MSSSPLEAKLEAIARRFIGDVMGALGEASLSDLAAYAEKQRASRGRPAGPTAVTPKRTKVVGKGPAPTRERRSAANLSELEDRIVEELRGAAQPMGARAIANAVAVPLDKIGAPLKALRDAGRVKKIGDKRASVYSV